ncbi:ABC transporter permease [Streptococcus pneumoniae]|uniref:ABC transporter permease n=1 Tax=Streptococcus pneumoniae TaxID=1313 RepID=UPI0005DCE2F9|nr:ABC transporter permease [Streptococcus pneumoniae]CEV42598.1 ABC transporter permease [Streptococcus pneumoniae]CFA06168.1 ABC transporter permease [Streptococcus pneumoniae]CIP67414.1 ABC transporter permease [Streptococcus pneumoniae]CIQ50793.1 ABC transporter permease [Streptococcus pneumoniae]CIT00489.1 ABC transporter permease [Streptococcus pneumoniae]
MIKRKTYWKDLIQSFTSSKGRFLSILTLMMLGSLALIGLKVTSPNMEATANAYLTTAQTLDLAVMSNYGLDQADQEELKQTEGAEVEFGYLTDVTMDNGQDAIRLYSKPERISTFQLRKGRLPQSDKEIALTTHLQDQYSVGQEISFKEKEEGHSSLKDHTYTITGFVDSAEILSQRDMGYAGSGSGTLTAYGVILPSQFDQKVYNIARLKYQDLAGLNAFSSAYEEKSKQHQEELEQILSDNGKVRLQVLKKEGQESLDKGQETLDKAHTNLQEGKRRLAAAQARIQAQESQLALFPQVQREQASAQLTQAKQELGKEEDKLKQAEQNLAQEKEKLEKHQQVLDDLAEPRYQVYNHQTMPGGQGYLMYSNASSSIRAVGNIFPVVLYAVAAMVTFTTMTRFIYLQHHQQELTLKDGIVITAKLAQLAGVKVGQTLEIEGKKLKVAAITENYVGHFIYMSQASYEQLYGQLSQVNTYLVSLRDTSATSIESQAGLLMNQSAVSSVVQNASAIRLFDSIASSLNQTMTILVIVSVLLAIVILYNLTNINVAERIRELSTIKVLGFHNNEVTLYIYRETIVLSLVGIVLGLVAGFYLHQFLIQMISPATILFYPQVGWEVYVIPVATVSIILTLLGFFVNYYLRKVDMLEALKSVE